MLLLLVLCEARVEIILEALECRRVLLQQDLSRLTNAGRNQLAPCADTLASSVPRLRAISRGGCLEAKPKAAQRSSCAAATSSSAACRSARALIAADCCARRGSSSARKPCRAASTAWDTIDMTRNSPSKLSLIPNSSNMSNATAAPSTLSLTCGPHLAALAKATRSTGFSNESTEDAASPMKKTSGCIISMQSDAVLNTVERLIHQVSIHQIANG